MGPDPVLPGHIAINFVETAIRVVLAELMTSDNLETLIWSDEKQERIYEGYTQVRTVTHSPSGNIQAWIEKQEAEA